MRWRSVSTPWPGREALSRADSVVTSARIVSPQTTGALSANATYVLTCAGAGGSSAAQSATVSVTQPVPSVTLAANPLVRSVDKAERLYAELAEAHRAHLPERLVA